MATHYQTCAETAKLIRKALKEAFPGVKFSVRSHTYSMGASINVSWNDGPTAADVEPVAEAFQGATFDGMTDYKGGVVHEFNGETVHFGADFIFCRRTESDALVDGARAAYAQLSPDERFAILEQSCAFTRCNSLRFRDEGLPLDDAALDCLGDDAGEVFRAIARITPLCRSQGSATAESAVVVRTY